MATDELDPDIAAALAEDAANEGLSDEFDDEEGNDPDPQRTEAIRETRAEVASSTIPEKPKNKGGRPRKHPVKQASPEASNPAAAPPRPIHDMATIWDDIVEKMRSQGFGGPEVVTISVQQLVIGPERGEVKKLSNIDGAAVSGSSRRTPGEDLQDYIERVMHVPLNTGAAKYRLTFQLRGARPAERILGRAEITLPAAVEIRQRWAAADRLRKDREEEERYAPLPPRPMPGRGYDAGAPQTYGQVPAAPATPSAAPAGPSMESQLLDRVWNMWMADRQEALRLGRQPPPPPDPRLFGAPPAAAASPGISKDDIAAVVAQTVVQTLQAYGIKPQGPGMDPPQQAAPPAIPLTAPVVQQTVTAPMDAAEAFFTQMRKFKKMETEMREMFGPEEEEEPEAAPPAQPTVITPPAEDPTAMKPVNEAFARFEGAPIMFGKQGENESTFQWLTRLATANPAIAGKLLEKGATLLDQGMFGQLVAKFAAMGGQAAQAVQARQMPAAQQTNGAPQGAWKPSID